MDDREESGQCFSCGFFGHGEPMYGGGGVTFTEVHVSTSVNEDDKFIAQASGQHVVSDTDLGEVPAILSALPGDTLVNQPEIYSAQKIDPDGIPMEEVVVLEPLEFSAPDACLDSRSIAGNMDLNPSKYVVHIEEQTRRPTEGVTSPAPVRHSVMQFHRDSQPGRNKLKPDQSGDPLPNGTPRRQVDVCGSQTVPDFLVDVNMDGGGNPVPKPAPSDLAEHLTSVEHSLRPKYPNENGGGNPVPKQAPSELAEHLTSVEHSLRSKYPNEDEGGDPVPKPAPSGLAERSTSVEHSPGPIYPMLDDKSGRRVCFSDNQPVSEPRQSDNQEIRKPSSVRTPHSVVGGSANQQALSRHLLLCHESSRSHDSRRTQHRWMGWRTWGTV